jgi:hypothetical protein
LQPWCRLARSGENVQDAPVERSQDPYAPPETVVEGRAAKGERHTRLGIASLVLAGVSVLAIVAYFVCIGLLVYRFGGEREVVKWMPVAFLCIGASVAASVAGLVLGIAGLFRVDRRRWTAGVGTLIHAGILFVYLFFVVISVLVGSELIRQS